MAGDSQVGTRKGEIVDQTQLSSSVTQSISQQILDETQMV